jgi:hypothetical protein
MVGTLIPNGIRVDSALLEVALEVRCSTYNACASNERAVSKSRDDAPRRSRVRSTYVCFATLDGFVLVILTATFCVVCVGGGCCLARGGEQLISSRRWDSGERGVSQSW